MGDLPVQQGVAVLRRPDNVVFNLELGVAANSVVHPFKIKQPLAESDPV